MKCLYDFYQNGYDNGIAFAYIPDNMTKKQKKAWEMGYRDTLYYGKHKDIDEFEKVFSKVDCSIYI